MGSPARVNEPLGGSTHGKQDASRRQSPGLRPTSLSGCPRTVSRMPTDARAPVLGFWPLRVSTHEQQPPLGVRAPVLGRPCREEGDDERGDEEVDVAGRADRPRTRSCEPVCLGAVTPARSPALPGHRAAKGRDTASDGTREVSPVKTPARPFSARRVSGRGDPCEVTGAPHTQVTEGGVRG